MLGSVHESSVLRALAIGRRNWTFLGSDRGGRTAAVLYPLTGTCRHHDIDPFAYLQDVLGRLPFVPKGQSPPAGSFAYLQDVLGRLPSLPADQLGALLPDVWFASHPAARRKRAA